MRCNKHINVLGIVLLNMIYMVLVYNLRVHWSMLLRNPDNLTLYRSSPFYILLKGGVLEPLLAVVFCLGLVCGVLHLSRGLAVRPDKLLLGHSAAYLLGLLAVMLYLAVLGAEMNTAKMYFRIFSVDALLAAVICVAVAWLWRLAGRQK